MSGALKGLGSSAMPAIAWVGTPIAATDDRLHRVDLGQRARNTKVLPTRNRACRKGSNTFAPANGTEWHSDKNNFAANLLN